MYYNCYISLFSFIGLSYYKTNGIFGLFQCFALLKNPDKSGLFFKTTDCTHSTKVYI